MRPKKKVQKQTISARSYNSKAVEIALRARMAQKSGDKGY